MTPDVTYRVVAQHGAQQIPIKDGFDTREDALRYVEDHCIYEAPYSQFHIQVIEEKSQRQKYYEFIDILLENARRELSSEDMLGLINDLGVVLDMHFDGIRREVEGEYDEE